MRLAVVALVFAGGPALAECASPNAFLVPESGVLPSKAVLHVFAPGWAPSVTSTNVVQLKKDLAQEHGGRQVGVGMTTIGVYDASGEWINARVSVQLSSDAFQVFRVEVSAPQTTALAVHMNDREYHYTVGEGGPPFPKTRCSNWVT